MQIPIHIYIYDFFFCESTFKCINYSLFLFVTICDLVKINLWALGSKLEYIPQQIAWSSQPQCSVWKHIASFSEHLAVCVSVCVNTQPGKDFQQISWCSSTKSDALTQNGHEPRIYAPGWPLAPAHWGSSSPGSNNPLYWASDAPYTHYSKAWYNMSLEIFLLFPPEILPSDHYCLGFKTSCSSPTPQEFTSLLATICSIFQPGLENKPNITHR